LWNKQTRLFLGSRQIPHPTTRVSSINSSFAEGGLFFPEKSSQKTETKKYGGGIIKCQASGENARVSFPLSLPSFVQKLSSIPH